MNEKIMYCSFFKLILIILISTQNAGASMCKRFKVDLQEGSNSSMASIEYSCPGLSDPKHHTECCSNEAMQGCCAQSRYFYEIDKTLATTIAVSVTSLCVFITLIIAICCFWSRCPLYSVCRVHYTHDIATYVSKSDNIDMETMPRELSGKKNNTFSPLNISNGNLPIGSEMEVV